MLTHKEETAKTEVLASAYLDSFAAEAAFFDVEEREEEQQEDYGLDRGFCGSPGKDNALGGPFLLA